MNVLLVVREGTPERQKLEDFFAQRRHDVRVVTSAAAARQELAATIFTYVFVDLVLDGAADVCRVVREAPQDQTYLLVLPVAETVEAMRAALAAGADDYLIQPINMAALQLHLALGDRRLARRKKHGQDLEDARRKGADNLHFREQYFRSLLENSSDLITIVDGAGNVLYQSASSQNLMGIRADDMMGAYFFGYLHPDDLGRVTEAFNGVLSSPGGAITVQCRIRSGKDDWRHFEALCKNLLDDPVVGGIVITSRDISEHRKLENDLKKERTFFQQLFRNSPTGIVILDPKDQVVDANRSFLGLFKYDLEEIRKKRINELIVPPELTEEAASLSQAIASKQPVDHETTRWRSDDSPVEVSVIGFPIEINDRLIGGFGIYSDITQRKSAERKLFHQAFHDALTGLPNRMLLNERLERTLKNIQRNPGQQFALLFIDLDRFKVINDSLGHAAGDELLMEMSRRLEAAVRPGDTVARLGGDEFTIILESLNEPSDATSIAQRILDSLSQPFHVGGEEVVNSGSIGIAFSSPRYANAEEIVRDADIAMYRAKAAGKAQYAIFDEEMHKNAMVRLQLETELRRAVEQGLLEVYYLPVVSMATRRVASFEALLRWSHPRRGIMTAAELIPICEESGLIVQLGRWVFQTVCQQVRDWQERFPDSDCVVSINLAAKETAHNDFLKEIIRITKETGVKPASLGFELAESLIVASDDSLKETLWELQRRGFRLYIDDFGTDKSSLASLYRFPMDFLKIDRTLIRNANPGSGNMEIVRAISALGESLGLSVVAEGVEGEEHLELVRKLEIPYAQGFHFTRPVPAAVAEKLFETEMLAEFVAPEPSASIVPATSVLPAARGKR